MAQKPTGLDYCRTIHSRPICALWVTLVNCVSGHQVFSSLRLLAQPLLLQQKVKRPRPQYSEPDVQQLRVHSSAFLATNTHDEYTIIGNRYDIKIVTLKDGLTFIFFSFALTRLVVLSGVEAFDPLRRSGVPVALPGADLVWPVTQFTVNHDYIFLK